MRPKVKLGEIATIQAGGTPNRSKKEYYEGGNIPRLKSGELNDSFSINENEEFITKLGMENSSAKLFKKGTLLMAMYGATAGKLGILNIDATTNQAVCSIQNTKGLFDNLYVFYYLFLIRNKIIIDSFGGAQPNISKDYIKNIEIPLPPLETQKTIVAKLDQIFSELDQTKSEIQKNLDNTDELWKSALNQAFQGDWEKKKLGEIGSLTRGKGFLKSDFVENGFPCIHYGQIHMKFDTAIDKNITYISEELAKKSGIAEKNDIIIAITSEDVEGSCKSVAWLGNYPVAVGAHAAIYKHTQNPLFVSYYLQTSMFFNQKINYTHGSKVVEIKPIDVGNCVIPVPPFSEQERIVEHLNQVSKEVKEIKFQYQSQIDNLEELKKSVLYKTFRGELGE